MEGNNNDKNTENANENLKNTAPVTNKAISGSKKLADINAAKEKAEREKAASQTKGKKAKQLKKGNYNTKDEVGVDRKNEEHIDVDKNNNLSNQIEDVIEVEEFEALYSNPSDKKENNADSTVTVEKTEKIEDVEKTDGTLQESSKDDVTKKTEEASKESVADDVTKKTEEASKESAKDDATKNAEEASKESVADDVTKKTEEASEESAKDDATKNAEEASKESVADDVIKKTEEASKESAKDDSYEKKKNNIVEDKTNGDNNTPYVVSNVKSNKKILRLVGGILAGLLLCVYIAGVFYFSSHFYTNVSINGVEVSGMNKAAAQKKMESFYDAYSLKIIAMDGTEHVLRGTDISMQITMKENTTDCIKQQKPQLWMINLFRKHTFIIDAVAQWDQEQLKKAYENFDMLNSAKMQEPVDAYVGVVDGKFVIVQQEQGSTILKEEFENAIDASLKTVVSEINLFEAGCYKLPKIYEDDETLQKELSIKKEFAKNEITLQLDDLQLEPGVELYESILEKKGDTYVISANKVKNYVKKLAKTYDTKGTERTFSTSWGDKKIMTLGETFGYVINQEETVEALNKALDERKNKIVDVVFEQKGYTLKEENDIGDTYIEVNLSEQHVYAYKDGKVIAEADCVSGCESLGHGTCIGLYAIQNKLSPTVLRGEKKPVTKTVTKKNKKGKKVKTQVTTYEYEYESPVTYWMQFNGGIGLHDAAGWRSVYGGSIYYYDGSHGCVNLPLDFAGTLYKNYDVGTPVIVYFWDNEKRK